MGIKTPTLLQMEAVEYYSKLLQSHCPSIRRVRSKTVEFYILDSRGLP